MLGRALRRAGFPVALVLMGVVAAISYGRVLQFRNDVYWRGHTHQVLEHIERMQTAFLAAQTARYTYRLSRDPGDREEMDAQIAAGDRETAAVDDLTHDNAGQQRRLVELRPIVADHASALHDGIDLPLLNPQDTQARDAEMARRVHRSDVARRLRAAIDEMRDEELRLLDEREKRTLDAADSTERTLLFGSGVALALLAAIYTSLVLEARARLRAQTQLAEANTLFNAVFETTTDVIAVKDTSGHYMLINPAGCRNLGRNAADVLGRTDLEVLSAGTGESIMEKDREVLRRGETITFEQVATVGDRTWTFSATKGPFKGPDGEVRGIIAVSRDVSERKAMEERLAAQIVERQENVERLQKRSEELAALGAMARLLQSARSAAEMYDLVGNFATRLFGTTGGAFGVLAPESSRIEVVSAWGGPQSLPPFERDDCWALRSGHAHTTDGKGAACTHVGDGERPCLCVPLVAQGETLGLLQLWGDEVAHTREQLLWAFSEQLSLALANTTLRETLRAQAIRDPMTKLFNRRYMDETLERELSRVRRKGAPLTVVMVDVDHFKRLNDTAGHAAGDEVLKHVARLLMTGVRHEDVPCRYGGEEFAIVLPELPTDRAAERAERLRRDIETAYIQVDGQRVGPVTASFGVATFPGHGQTGEALLRVADAALYEAKHQGRNRVMVASSNQAPPAPALKAAGG